MQFRNIRRSGKAFMSFLCCVSKAGSKPTASTSATESASSLPETSPVQNLPVDTTSSFRDYFSFRSTPRASMDSPSRRRSSDAMKYRLLLRIHSAENLRHVSSHGTYCKIYVTDHDMTRGSRSSLKQMLLLEPVPDTKAASGEVHLPNDAHRNGSRYHIRKTGTQPPGKRNPMWNEKFEIPVSDPANEILSIRVKSARLMTTPAIGACAISLRDLDDLSVDKWVELKAGKKSAGKLRLQMRMLSLSQKEYKARQAKVDSRLSRSKVNQPNEQTDEEPTVAYSIDEEPPPSVVNLSVDSYVDSKASIESEVPAEKENGPCKDLTEERTSNDSENAQAIEEDTATTEDESTRNSYASSRPTQRASRRTDQKYLSILQASESSVFSARYSSRAHSDEGIDGNATSRGSDGDDASHSMHSDVGPTTQRPSTNSDEFDTDSEESDFFDGDSPRMRFNPSLMDVLTRDSANVLMEEDEAEEDEVDDVILVDETGRSRQDSMPMLDFPVRQTLIDDVDRASLLSK